TDLCRAQKVGFAGILLGDLGGDEELVSGNAARTDAFADAFLRTVFSRCINMAIPRGDGCSNQFGRAMRQLHGAKADCRHLCAVCCEGKCFWRLHRKLSRTWRWNVGADKLLSNVDLHGSYDAFPMRHFVSLPGFGIGERLVWDEI